MFELIMNDILGTPAILIGLFALIGLLLQKKSATDTVSGTLKTTMGFLLLGVGAAVVSDSLGTFRSMFEAAFQIQGVVPNTDAMAAIAQENYGTETALIMIFGMVVNLLLARFTPFKYVFLTGHHTLYMAAMLAVVLVTGGMSGVPLVLIGSLILGAAMVIAPAVLQPFTRKITGNDDLALGHFGTFGYFTAGLVGKLVGNPEKSTETIQIPKSLGFLRDTSVAVSLTMALLFFAITPFAGIAVIEELSGGTNYAVFILIQAITFAAGVYIILAGVRMAIGEIVPAFKGIADKFVKGAKPALDAPTVFPFAPNAVIIGFLCSFAGGIASIFLLPLVGLTVIVPGLVPHFFCGATAGVYGNATGGLRGAVVGSFVNGILISFLPALLLPVLGSLGLESTTFGDTDFGIIGILLGYFIQLFT
ncbi:PTS ascorbate transporter subunit IIC [Shouchella clausii]|jgi:ascorbate PTS system EIIC component|uniref:Ascorbate-specific PTS system EIIC component n=1 Tax=Shouchella clausii TaxID=79880 RepID=A0A268S2L9_SHOCL|nr:PTS ascorbate transporter subunit IIC [Shouchella clausii]PAD43994.1 PTS ascorbate transporter subunit IIC [Bacillus sp. 7520-S]MBU8595923.1 PTS ascorbate transporter subunit IIC [Shouchella clausii]MCY1103107.1 PTS ascorbate transporter subunit IIC [Shouchella clausii]MEB5478088.1 PTS ascorbate transporter subunit IIC [Shouchella clausii]MED4157571.1 PTS ascorbate transporter subunit IIC [Shouchella clausii]